MPHGAACTCYPVTTRKSHDHRYHQTSLSRARDGTGKKRKGKKDQREWLCMFQNGKPVSDFIHVLHACCVGLRNFCGYLILRFFPNRKNSQNKVPANNSNNEVTFALGYTKLNHYLMFAALGILFPTLPQWSNETGSSPTANTSSNHTENAVAGGSFRTVLIAHDSQMPTLFMDCGGVTLHYRFWGWSITRRAGER